MARKAASQTDEIAGAVDNIVGRLAPRAGAVKAGESISSGLEGFKAGVKNLQVQLYDKLDDHLPPATPITVSRTKDALAALNADIDGAPALSAMFKNGKIQGVERALAADLNTGTTAYGAHAARKTSTLPYESIKKLRALVGMEIDNSSFVSDVPRDKWKALYAALSEDLGDAAQKAGPDAYGAWKWANKFSKDQLDRLDDLASVAGKDTPEKIFNAAMMGTADGDTMLQRVISALPKMNRRDLAAVVVKRMGRATAGNQNEVGDTFSTSTFLTNWNKLSPEAQHAFRAHRGSWVDGRTDEPGGGVQQHQERFEVSGEPQRHGAGGRTSGAAGGQRARRGNRPMAGAWIDGGRDGGTNALARIMTRPGTVDWLSQATRLSDPAVLGGLQALFPKQ